METKITWLPTEAMQQTQQWVQPTYEDKIQKLKEVASYHETHCAVAEQALTSEIESLRQQVAELLNTVADNATVYVETLATQELEILKLREALKWALGCTDIGSWIEDGDMKPAVDAYNKAKQALSTPLTTEHLNEWLKERLGEPVCAKTIATDDGYIQIPLYSVKEIV